MVAPDASASVFITYKQFFLCFASVLGTMTVTLGGLSIGLGAGLSNQGKIIQLLDWVFENIAHFYSYRFIK